MFVLPNGEVFGSACDSLVLQTGHITAGDAYSTQGTLVEWQDVVQYAAGNDLLVLVVSTAFAGALLDIVGEPSGGLHLAVC